MQNSLAQDFEVSDLVLGILEKQNWSISSINVLETPILTTEIKEGKRKKRVRKQTPVCQFQ